MGLTGFYEFLRKKAPDCIDSTSLSAFAGQSIGIDGNLFLRQRMSKTGPDVPLLSKFLKDMGNWMRSHDVEPVFALDGKVLPRAKLLTAQIRESRRRKADDKVAELEELIRTKRRRLDELALAQALGMVTATAAGKASADVLVQALPTSVSDVLQPGRPPSPGTVELTSDTLLKTTSPVLPPVPTEDKVDAPAGASPLPNVTSMPAAPGVAGTGSEAFDRVDPALRLSEGREELRGLETNHLKQMRQTWRLTFEQRQEIAHELSRAGFICEISTSEADFLLAMLSRRGAIGAVATEDADMLPFSVNVLLRGLSSHMYSSSSCLERYTRATLLQKLEMTQAEFIELCILCKCDYVPKGLDKIGIHKAYLGIKKHKTIDAYVKSFTPKQKKTHKCDPNFAEQVVEARRLFTNPTVELQNDLPDLERRILGRQLARKCT